MAEQMTNREWKRARRERIENRVREAVAGTGRFIFENASRSEQRLPKEAEGGKTAVQPGEKFVGDSYFFTLAPDIKVVQVLSPPSAGDERVQDPLRAAEPQPKKEAAREPDVQKKQVPQRRTVFVVNPDTGATTEVVLPPKWKRGDDVFLVDRTDKSSKTAKLFVFSASGTKRFDVPKSWRVGDKVPERESETAA